MDRSIRHVHSCIKDTCPCRERGHFHDVAHQLPFALGAQIAAGVDAKGFEP